MNFHKRESKKYDLSLKKSAPERFSLLKCDFYKRIFQKHESQCSMKPKESENKSPEVSEKPAGLMNSALICYMNSMMQALSASSKLIENLSHLNESLPCKNDKLSTFVEILKSINDPTDESDSGVDVTERLKSFMNDVQWNSTSQEDAFQLLSYFINAIHKEINTEEIMPPKFQILHTFSEDPKYNKIQDHLGFALPLVGTFRDRTGVNVEQMFDSYFATSFIDDGPYNTSMVIFDKAPDVMIAHIQANEWNYRLGRYDKPIYYINYDQTLKYEFKIAKESLAEKFEQVDVTYQLVAVVEHTGSISGGHYVTYRKCGPNWFLTNDAQVEEIIFDCKVTPYIMVYEKM